MNKFIFDKKEQKLLQVEIANKQFSLNPYTLAVKKATEKFVKCQKPLIEKISKRPSEKELDRIIIQSCSLVRETINQILGKGSYERIFAGRTLDFNEHQKLIEFLFNEIADFCKHNPIVKDDESIT